LGSYPLPLFHSPAIIGEVLLRHDFHPWWAPKNEDNGTNPSWPGNISQNNTLSYKFITQVFAIVTQTTIAIMFLSIVFSVGACIWKRTSGT
jgi:hypothetical protein